MMPRPVIFLVLLIACTTNVPTETRSTTSMVRDQGSIGVHFCPKEDCESLLMGFLSTANKSIHCAFYDFNLEDTGKLLTNKSKTIETKLVIDGDNSKKARDVLNTSIREDKGSALMHNKFCIIDEKRVLTGSMNPTVRDTRTNNNNLIFIESQVIAQNYEREFAELWNGEKNRGGGVQTVMLNRTLISMYFCPEDECADKVIRTLEKAKSSIDFMTFSFTHAGIVNILLLKKQDGLEIRGVYEKSQLSKHSTYDLLKFQGADVHIDGNKYNLHHKVFIIDNETVITGSFNPSKNADERNDENVVIIESKEVAHKFLEEFKGVYNEAVMNISNQSQSNITTKP